jgi:hypothetical protein
MQRPAAYGAGGLRDPERGLQVVPPLQISDGVVIRVWSMAGIGRRPNSDTRRPGDRLAVPRRRDPGRSGPITRWLVASPGIAPRLGGELSRTVQDDNWGPDRPRGLQSRSRPALVDCHPPSPANGRSQVLISTLRRVGRSLDSTLGSRRHLCVRRSNHVDQPSGVGSAMRCALHQAVPAVRRRRRRPSMYGRPGPTTATVLPRRPSQEGSGSGGSEPARSSMSTKYA